MRVLVALMLVTLVLLAQKSPAFADEFNGSEVDLLKWVPHDPWASGRTPDLATVSNGELHLKAGQAMTTFGHFSQVYGRVDIRLRLPLVAGARFRLLPAKLAAFPSIDVFRADGNKIAFGNIWGDARTERSFGDSFAAPPAGMHVITAEWEHAKIKWSIDGKEKIEAIDGIPDQPMFLALDGPMDVDYIRVN
jgi:beta-glucanase (GH16 family)